MASLKAGLFFIIFIMPDVRSSRYI